MNNSAFVSIERTIVAISLTVAAVVGLAAFGSPTPVFAACKLGAAAPYAPYSYSPSKVYYDTTSNAMTISESANSGACNNNGTYNSSFSITSDPMFSGWTGVLYAGTAVRDRHGITSGISQAFGQVNGRV